MKIIGTIACLAGGVLAMSATTAYAGALEDCNSSDMERRITGCTAALKTLKFDKKNKALIFSNRGKAYLEKKQYDAALVDFNECIKLKPTDEYCWISKSYAHSLRGEEDEVIKTYKVLIDLYRGQPQTDEIKASQVLIEVDACELLAERAKERFEKAAGSITNFTLPADADKPGIESAIKDLTDCLYFGPGDPEALGNRALYQHLLGRNKEAVGDAEASHKEDPKNVQALAVLAITSLGDKDYTRSLEFSQQWHNLAADNINAERQLAKALEAAGRKEEAAALTRVSENRERCNAVMEAVMGGQTASADDGIAACTTVIEAAGSNVSGLIAPHEFRGYLRGIRGDNEGSIADYTRAIEISGGAGRFALFYTQRGNKYVALKKHDLAVADFDAALKQQPDDVSALSGRASSKLELSRYDEAKADFERVKQLLPNDASAYGGLGDIAAKAGKYEDAVTDYSKFLELQPEHAIAYQARGLSHEKLGRKEQAIADFRKALSIDPGLAESTEALKRLGASP